MLDCWRDETAITRATIQKLLCFLMRSCCWWCRRWLVNIVYWKKLEVEIFEKHTDEQLSDGLEQSNLPCFYSYRCQHWGNSCHRHVVTGGSWRHVVVVVEFSLWLNRESCCVWINKPWERDLEWGSRMVVVVRVDIGRVKKRREEQPLLLLWQKLDVSWWCCLRTVTAITGSGTSPSKCCKMPLQRTRPNSANLNCY